MKISRASKHYVSGLFTGNWLQAMQNANVAFTGNHPLAKEFDCGFWKLFKYKCQMNPDRECDDLAVVQITDTSGTPMQGSICADPPGSTNIALWGLEQAIQTLQIMGTARVTDGGNSTPSQAQRGRGGWDCGERTRPACCFFNTPIPSPCPDEAKATDNRNDYIGWFIRIYDYDGTSSSYRPFDVDDPTSPSPSQAHIRNCAECPGDQPPPNTCQVSCSCNEDGPCPHMIWITNPPFQDVTASQTQCDDWEAICFEIDWRAEFTEEELLDCECIPRPPRPRPPIDPPPPPPPPDPPWSGPGGVGPWIPPSWTGPTGPGISWPSGPSSWGPGSPGTGPSAGPGWTGPGGVGPGDWQPPPPLPPDCHVTVRVNCPPRPDGTPDPRIICFKDGEAEDNLPNCDDIQVPFKNQDFELFEREVRGLINGTYYVPKT